jgi:hypothetical protein
MLLGARQPPALRSLLQSLLRLLRKLIGAFLTLLPLSLLRLQSLQTLLLRWRQLPLLRASLQTLLQPLRLPVTAFLALYCALLAGGGPRGWRRAGGSPRNRPGAGRAV